MWENRPQSHRRNLRRIFKTLPTAFFFFFCLAHKNSDNLQVDYIYKENLFTTDYVEAKMDLRCQRKKPEWERHWNNVCSSKNLVRHHFLSSVRQLRHRCWKMMKAWIEIGVGSQFITSLLVLGRQLRTIIDKCVRFLRG